MYDLILSPNIVVNGSPSETIEVGENFRHIILKYAKSHGLTVGDRFKILVNGISVKPLDAPDTIEPHHSIEIISWKE